jgi:hypothetical protein
MKKKVVLVGLVIILLGVVMAFIGFSEVTPYVMVYSGNLPPGQSVVKELRPGLDSVALTFNSSYPLRVVVDGGTLLKQESLSGSISLVLNGSSPILSIENNGTSVVKFTVASTSITSMTEFGGVLFIVGALVSFIGLAILIYGLIRRS